MQYSQEVRVKKINMKKVVESFHDIKIVKFLTLFQPIKIIEWSGIENKKVAHFKLWFLGWQNFKVEHSDYKLDDDGLYFIDNGILLPLGLSFWRHEHIVRSDGEDVIIEDRLAIKHKSAILGVLLFPMLIFPIVIRKFLYNIFYRRLKSI